METYPEETLPDDAHYLGTANDDGTMYAWLADAIDQALAPARVQHSDGVYSYFDLGA